jgi:endoglucanase
LTKAILDIAAENDIPHQIIAEPSETGTDADIIGITRCGIPTAVISIPLSGMHTYTETISMGDVKQTSTLLALLLKSEKIPEIINESHK